MFDKQTSPPPSDLNKTLPAFAAKRDYRSIFTVDSGAQQQTRRPPLLLSIDVTERWTVTDGHPTVTKTLIAHIMRAASINRDGDKTRRKLSSLVTSSMGVQDFGAMALLIRAKLSAIIR